MKEKIPVEIGERVVAVSTIDDEHVYIFGFGVYQGGHIPPEDFTIEEVDLTQAPEPNPLILLDNGKTVWGYECWWLRESDFQKAHSQLPRVIEQIDIDEHRRKYLYPQSTEIN